MTSFRRAAIRAALFAAVLAWTACYLPQKITLTTADIGRHLKNGELIAGLLKNSAAAAGTRAVLDTNFYSYTHPEFKALNHHWSSGLIFYEIHRRAGYEGLSLFQTALLLAAWALLFALAVRRGGWAWAVVWALWLIPVFGARKEIRPEAFSVLLTACFVTLFERHRDGRLSSKRLAVCAAFLQVLWTNLHIYFVLGPFIAAVYGVAAASGVKGSAKERWKSPAGVFAGVCAATLVNPFGWNGALYPFFIFGDYGYRLVENQSIPFLERLKVAFPTFPFFKTASIALACAAALEALVRRRLPSPAAFLALLFAAAGWRAIRNFQLFALFALPVLAAAFSSLTDYAGRTRWIRRGALVFGAVSALAATLALHGGHPLRLRPGFGAGLAEGSTASADFFREEGLKGPIFNNYDIGGYLIHELWPAEKVFVDNRPEAYPGEFFKTVVIPAQEEESRWRALDGQYRFNVIFFSYHDLTPWAQAFMLRRLEDSEWAPVFADSYAIVFLRRTVENSSVIVRRELPRSMFRVISNR